MLAVGDVTRAYARVGVVLSEPKADWHDLMDAATVLLITSQAVAQALDNAAAVEEPDTVLVTAERPLHEMNEALQWVLRCGQGASCDAVRHKLEEAWRSAGTLLEALPSSS